MQTTMSSLALIKSETLNRGFWMNIFSKRNNYEDERYNQNYSNDSSKISE